MNGMDRVKLEWAEYEDRVRRMSNSELLNEGSYQFQGKSNFRIDMVRKEVLRRKRDKEWSEESYTKAFVRKAMAFEVLTVVVFTTPDVNRLEAYGRPSEAFAEIVERMRFALFHKNPNPAAEIKLRVIDLIVLTEATDPVTKDEASVQLDRMLRGVNVSHGINECPLREENRHFHQLLQEANQRSVEINVVPL